MSEMITADRLVEACGDDSHEAGIKIVTELEPVGGPGTPVKPAVYEGGRYQTDRRWESVDAEAPTDVVVIDNVPSQANRLEEALRRHRGDVGLPEFILDLSPVGGLPAHLPTSVSSWQFPHRNADAYLRDSQIDGEDFAKSDLGRSIFDATPENASALIAWFPQGLLYGFWQSHLGKKRANTKHARAWVSEIIGWRPATIDTKVMGLKGDVLNLSVDEKVVSNENDREEWAYGKTKVEGGKADRLSEMGHGQVPFMKDGDASPAGVSFPRLTQTATVSFSQLRRVSLRGDDANPNADSSARALLVGVGLYAHVEAFTHAFSLRSGADLRPTSVAATWLGSTSDNPVDMPDSSAVSDLISELRSGCEQAGVALDGWDQDPTTLTPKENLAAAIRASWPLEA